MPEGIPFEPLKLLFSIVFFFAAISCNWAALAYVHDFINLQALPDISYIIPQNEEIAFMGDIIGFLLTLCLVILMILHKHRHVVSKRIFFLGGWIYWMRCITLTMTHIPPGYVDGRIRCQFQVKNEEFRTFDLYWKRWVTLAKGLGTQDVNKPMLCGDLLFSGHTLIMCFSAMAVRYYIPKKLRLISYLTSIIAVIGMICMVISRAHYSADVLIAYWITTFVFTIYHAYIETLPFMREDTAASKLWLIKVADWLEENVDNDFFENKFQLPCFSWTI
ncbi:unnamed protein product [Bursaphelenchus xylophilus]|uniref:(pine wood nematode) hypothetical protein n=1 Tax=Bursaphelenchus xylophilus TaxID=6326 RepID=A0A1I7RUU0_BURXY|nr:unnamed protein product [Bursaphelenchus xylophilus]CAG9105455.1 unnamed protein product [Bursaphelenchus xylophilus]